MPTTHAGAALGESVETPPPAISFLSSSPDEPGYAKTESLPRPSVRSLARPISRRPSKANTLTGAPTRGTSPKPTPVRTKFTAVTPTSQLLSPPTTLSIPNVQLPSKRPKLRRYDPSLLGSATVLTSDSITPSASASQVPSHRPAASSSRPVSSSKHKHPIISTSHPPSPVHISSRRGTNDNRPTPLPASPAISEDDRLHQPRAGAPSQSTISFASTALRSPAFRLRGHKPDMSCRPISPPTIPSRHISNPPKALDVSFLPPQTHRTPHGYLTVLNDSGGLVVDLRESERRSGRPGNEVLKVSQDGMTVSPAFPAKIYLFLTNYTQIEVFRAPSLSAPCVLVDPISAWNIQRLPKVYWKRYRFASRFLDLLKSRTPKVRTWF